MNEEKKILAALNALEKKQKANAFDAFKPDSRPNAKQLVILKGMQKIKYRYVVAGNRSGKSALAARELAWLLTDTHPYFKKPASWNDRLLCFPKLGFIKS